MLCKVLTTPINARLIDVVKPKTFMPVIATDSKCTTPIKEEKIKISLPKNVVKYFKLFISYLLSSSNPRIVNNVESGANILWKSSATFPV